MKNNKIWYLGYFVVFFSLILLFTLKGNEIRNILLTLIFAISTSISSVKIMHNKILSCSKSIFARRYFGNFYSILSNDYIFYKWIL